MSVVHFQTVIGKISIEERREGGIVELGFVEDLLRTDHAYDIEEFAAFASDNRRIDQAKVTVPKNARQPNASVVLAQ